MARPTSRSSFRSSFRSASRVTRGSSLAAAVLPAAVLAAAAVSGCTMQRMQPSSPSGNYTPVALSGGSAAPAGVDASMAMPSMDDHTAHMSAADMAAPAAVGFDVSQDRPGLPPSANGAPARLKDSPRHSEWVKIAWAPGSSDSLMAFVVYPKSASASAKAPVVVVVHEIFGLSTWVRGVADQVAADGFIAVAPDLLSRVRGGPTTVELSGDSARKLIGGVDAAERNKGIIAVANYAMTRPSATQKYAVIGYCWGGTTTFMHTINGGVKGFSGGVAFYGLPYMTDGTPATATTAAVPSTVNADSLAKITKPIMLLSGSGDARIGAAMPELEATMKSMNKDYMGMNYPGAIHGFLRAQDDGRAPRPAAGARPAETEEVVQAESAANLAATKDGWPRTVAFLKKNLGVK